MIARLLRRRRPAGDVESGAAAVTGAVVGVARLGRKWRQLTMWPPTVAAEGAVRGRRRAAGARARARLEFEETGGSIGWCVQLRRGAA